LEITFGGLAQTFGRLEQTFGRLEITFGGLAQTFGPPETAVTFSVPVIFSSEETFGSREITGGKVALSSVTKKFKCTLKFARFGLMKAGKGITVI